MTFGIKKMQRPSKIIIFLIVLVIGTVGLLWLRSSIHEANQTYIGKDAGQRIAFIIPGLNENENRYMEIERYYSDIGITPIFIEMDWLKPNFVDLIKDGNREIDKVISLYPDRDTYFFGFSFGAMIALNTAQEHKSKGTILCSLSPVFKDDLKDFPNWFKSIILPPSYISIPEEKTVFLYGDHDNKMVMSNEIVNRRKKIYSKSEFKIIKGAEHDITGKAYLEQIKQEIYKLKEVDMNE